jgi:hypothetical protein
LRTTTRPATTTTAAAITVSKGASPVASPCLGLPVSGLTIALVAIGDGVEGAVGVDTDGDAGVRLGEIDGVDVAVLIGVAEEDGDPVGDGATGDDGEGVAEGDAAGDFVGVGVHVPTVGVLMPGVAVGAGLLREQATTVTATSSATPTSVPSVIQPFFLIGHSSLPSVVR